MVRPRLNVSPKLSPLVWGAVLVAASLAFPTWKFGRRFLLQFWISPFQFFILPLWLLATVSELTGVMPVKSGPALRRDEDPERFRRNLRFTVAMGAVMFALNLCVSWLVVAR